MIYINSSAEDCDMQVSLLDDKTMITSRLLIAG